METIAKLRVGRILNHLSSNNYHKQWDHIRDDNGTRAVNPCDAVEHWSSCSRQLVEILRLYPQLACTKFEGDARGYPFKNVLHALILANATQEEVREVYRLSPSNLFQMTENPEATFQQLTNGTTVKKETILHAACERGVAEGVIEFIIEEFPIAVRAHGCIPSDLDAQGTVGRTLIATEAINSLLERGRLEKLFVTKYWGGKRVWESLKRNTTLRTLVLGYGFIYEPLGDGSEAPNHASEALAEVLAHHNTTVETVGWFDYRSSESCYLGGRSTSHSSIEYFSTLNKHGRRRRARDPCLPLDELISLLCLVADGTWMKRPYEARKDEDYTWLDYTETKVSMDYDLLRYSPVFRGLIGKVMVSPQLDISTHEEKVEVEEKTVALLDVEEPKEEETDETWRTEMESMLPGHSWFGQWQ